MEEQLRSIVTETLGSEGWELGMLLDNPGSPRQWCITLRAVDKLTALMTLLRDHPELKFNQLIDLTAVDYLTHPLARERFGVIYGLLSISFNRRVWVKVMLDEPDLRVATVVPIWGAANWLEREVYDMYGIVFDGHPNLKRILTPDNFEHYPMRKDYPLTGLGERDSFPYVGREDA